MLGKSLVRRLCSWDLCLVISIYYTTPGERPDVLIWDIVRPLEVLIPDMNICRASDRSGNTFPFPSNYMHFFSPRP